MTPSEQADALAKALHRYVAGQIPISRLRDLGWFDFLNNDRPETDDGVEMACAALLYLGTDVTGAWTGVEGVLIAVVAFLNAFPASRRSIWKTPACLTLPFLASNTSASTRSISPAPESLMQRSASFAT